MLLKYTYEFLCLYFVSILYEYAVYFIMCSSYQLKISKRKACVSAFFYANFLTITNTLSIILIAQRLVDETLLVIILTKLTSIAGELLIINFLIKSHQKVWYQSYWLTIVLHIILVIPMTYYMKVFVIVDGDGKTIFQSVNRSNVTQYLLSVCIMLFTYVVVWYLTKLIIKKIEINRVSKKFWVVIYAIRFGILLVSLKTYQESTDVSGKKIVGLDNYKELVIVLLVIVFCIAIAIIYSDQKVLKIENNLLKEQNELQYVNYMAMQQKELEIHKLYHDIGNHVKTIQILVEHGDNREANEYTKRLTEQYQNIRKGLYCNHKVINAVLIQKLKLCDDNNIRYEMDLTLPKSLSIQDIDLMCIYSNLLDNAIESCQRSPSSDDLIKIKTSQIGNYLGIKITNSKRSNLSQHISTSGYDTTKKDKSMHGYGLRIIDEIVKRYDGYKELQDSNVEFSAMVMLKLVPVMEDAIAAL